MQKLNQCSKPQRSRTEGGAQGCLQSEPSLPRPRHYQGILPPNTPASLATSHPGARMQQQGDGPGLNWACHNKVEKNKEGRKALQGAQIECLISDPSPTVTRWNPPPRPWPSPASTHQPRALSSLQSLSPQFWSLLVLNCVCDAKATILTGDVMS